MAVSERVVAKPEVGTHRGQQQCVSVRFNRLRFLGVFLCLASGFRFLGFLGFSLYLA